MKKIVESWLKGEITRDVLEKSIGFTKSNVLLNLDETDFSNQDIALKDFSNCSLINSNFENSNLRKASFKNSILDHSNFRCAYMHRASFADASVRYCNFSDCKDFTSVYLKNADFEGANISGVELSAVYPVALQAMYSSSIGLFEAKNLDQLAGNSATAISGFVRNLLDKNISMEYGDYAEEAEGLFSKIEKSLKLLHQIYSSKNDSPEILRPAIESLSLKLIQRIKENPNYIREIHPRAFEELVCEILASFGWKVHLTTPTNDGGYDIFAISRDYSGLESSWLVECKRYSAENKVGIDVIRSLYGVKSDLKVSNALIATTSTFTKGAFGFKNSRYDLQLCDFEKLTSWIAEYQPDRNGALHRENNSIILPNGIALKNK